MLYSKAFIFIITNKAFSDLLVVDLGNKVDWIPLITNI